MYIEDIYFFEVNTKYISSSVLKHQSFHEWEHFDVFNSRDDSLYIWFLLKNVNFLFILYVFRRLTVYQSTMLQTESQEK